MRPCALPLRVEAAACQGAGKYDTATAAPGGFPAVSITSLYQPAIAPDACIAGQLTIELRDCMTGHPGADSRAATSAPPPPRTMITGSSGRPRASAAGAPTEGCGSLATTSGTRPASARTVRAKG